MIATAKGHLCSNYFIHPTCKIFFFSRKLHLRYVRLNESRAVCNPERAFNLIMDARVYVIRVCWHVWVQLASIPTVASMPVDVAFVRSSNQIHTTHLFKRYTVRHRPYSIHCNTYKRMNVLHVVNFQMKNIGTLIHPHNVGV